jgi:heterodisulfide reductase subunit A-like polyferredoxin
MGGDMNAELARAGLPPSQPSADPGYVPAASAPATSLQEVETLKAQAKVLMAQVQAINTRVAEIGRAGEGLLVASVDASLCKGCGTCANACPSGAVTVVRIARIDTTECSGCGGCVKVCPQGALSLRKA